MDHDGALRIDARLTPDDGAVVLAALDVHSRRLRAEARARGDYENALAHEADALVELARSGTGDGPGGPGAMVHLHVDHSALLRGLVVDGERCEIPGVGPVPVAVVRRLLGDCVLKVIVTDGVDVTAVAHAGRTIPAHLRTALEARDPTCIVPGCDGRRDLQIDHRVPWIEGGPTSLDNLARLCRWHHYQKSHFGYRYRGGPGTWEWIPPERPTDPPSAPP
jgi:plasmid stabilization system protein ParE